MSRLPQWWWTQRNAIRNANCKTSWIIKILNAHCALRKCLRAYLFECLYTPLIPWLECLHTCCGDGLWCWWEYWFIDSLISTWMYMAVQVLLGTDNFCLLWWNVPCVYELEIVWQLLMVCKRRTLSAMLSFTLPMVIWSLEKVRWTYRSILVVFLNVNWTLLIKLDLKLSKTTRWI